MLIAGFIRVYFREGVKTHPQKSAKKCFFFYSAVKLGESRKQNYCLFLSAKVRGEGGGGRFVGHMCSVKFVLLIA